MHVNFGARLKLLISIWVNEECRKENISKYSWTLGGTEHDIQL